MLKVTRLSKYENLILEADIIRIGDEVSDLESTGKSDREKQDMYDKIDRMLDEILDKKIEEFLNNDNFVKGFSADSVIETVKEYIKYCRNRIKDTMAKITEYMRSSVPYADEVRLLNIEVAKIQDRIDALQQILKKAKNEKLTSAIDEILETKKEIVEYYSVPVLVKGQKIRSALERVKTAKDSGEKFKAAEEVFAEYEILDDTTQEYPNEAKSAINNAKAQTEAEVKNSIGEENFNSIKNKNKANIFFTKIVKDILEFEQFYGTEPEIKEKARLLRTVRIGQNEYIDTDSKLYLTAWVNQIEAALLKKAADKSLRLDLNKGIHYDFNIKLPLFKTVMIPVTGKQIADNTFIMKARKKSAEILGVLFGDTSTPDTQAGAAWRETGERISKVYSIALNAAAKAIGKAFKGREGEMKADAFSRLLMPTTEYLDAHLAKKTNEEAVSPGVSFDVPGSVSHMGPITPPTETTLGSGDDFSPKKKKKRIMEFSEFLKNKI